MSPASSGGNTWLRPAHLQAALGIPGQHDFIRELKDFANTCLKGLIPDEVIPCFLGAKVLALEQKEGGLRPVAIGETLRRLLGKVAVLRTATAFKGALEPFQVGVGTKGGAEGAIHAVRK